MIARLAIFLVLGCGCAGAHTAVTATNARYPVSFSHTVRDRDGALVTLDRRKVVGTFRSSRTAWAVFYSSVDLNSKIDVSEEINAQIASVGGDAIVNLVVTAKHCALSYFIVFNMLPFWPGCTNLYFEGDVIKVRSARTSEISP